MDQGKNIIIILVLIFILFYASKIIFFNNYFRIKFIKVWLTTIRMFGLILQRFCGNSFLFFRKKNQENTFDKKNYFWFFVFKIRKYDVFKEHFYFFPFVF